MKIELKCMISKDTKMTKAEHFTHFPLDISVQCSVPWFQCSGFEKQDSSM